MDRNTFFNAKFIVKNSFDGDNATDTYVVADNGKITLEIYTDNKPSTTVPLVNLKNGDVKMTERKHGHWHHDHDGDVSCPECKHYLYSQAIREASHCKDIPIVQELTPLCPYCGTIMDEEKHE